MQIRSLYLGPISTSTHIILTGGGNAIVVDPAEDDPDLHAELEGIEVPYIVNTHGHFDHIAGNAAVVRSKGSRVIVQEHDSLMLESPVLNGSALFGMTVRSPKAAIIIREEHTLLELDELSFEYLFFPGHTPGCMALYSETERVLLAGDFIFEDTIGRTDLPGGDMEQMRDSLERVCRMPDDTVVYPGHGDPFRLGDFKPVASFYMRE